MWVRVMKEFVDKYTGIKYKPGETLNIKKARYKEIREVDSRLVKEIKKD